MTAIWEPEARYRIWFEIEAHATEKLGELSVVPPSAAKALWDWWATNPAIDVAAIDEIEAVTKHDVIAFLTWVAEQVGEEARFMHQGMTSSDVLDTTLSVQLARASDISARRSRPTARCAQAPRAKNTSSIPPSVAATAFMRSRSRSG
jgi:adenylosuccinate lyase